MAAAAAESVAADSRDGRSSAPRGDRAAAGAAARRRGKRSPAREVLDQADALGGESAHCYLSTRYGFLPAPRLAATTPLPSPHSAWEALAASLARCSRTGDYRAALDACPLLPADESSLPERHLRRAAVLLGNAAHAVFYFSRAPGPEGVVPEKIAAPWAEVARRLGRPMQFLSYLDLFLHNWRLRDDAEAAAAAAAVEARADEAGGADADCGFDVQRHCEVLVPLFSGYGERDEEVFNLAMVDMHFSARGMVDAFVTASDGVVADDVVQVTRGLARAKRCIDALTRAFRRISPHPDSPLYVDPVAWAKTVAPVAVPIDPDARGPSGLAAPMMHLMDVALGRTDFDTEFGELVLVERMSWFPPLHRAFFEALGSVSIRDYVLRKVDEALKVSGSEAVALRRQAGDLRGVFDAAVAAYVAEDGFLGVHKIKVFGYMEAALKGGRLNASGGFEFQSDWRSRPWAAVIRALEDSTKEREPMRAGKCPFATAKVVSAAKCPMHHGAGGGGGSHSSATRAAERASRQRAARGRGRHAAAQADESRGDSESNRPTAHHFVFDVQGTGVMFEPGDRCAVLPRNDDLTVRRTVAALGIEPAESYTTRVRLNTEWVRSLIRNGDAGLIVDASGSRMSQSQLALIAHPPVEVEASPSRTSSGGGAETERSVGAAAVAAPAEAFLGMTSFLERATLRPLRRDVAMSIAMMLDMRNSVVLEVAGTRSNEFELWDYLLLIRHVAGEKIVDVARDLTVGEESSSGGGRSRTNGGRSGLVGDDEELLLYQRAERAVTEVTQLVKRAAAARRGDERRDALDWEALLANLAQLCPPLVPRQYSIAGGSGAPPLLGEHSSSEHTQSLELVVGALEYQTEAGVVWRKALGILLSTLEMKQVLSNSASLSRHSFGARRASLSHAAVRPSFDLTTLSGAGTRSRRRSTAWNDRAMRSAFGGAAGSGGSLAREIVAALHAAAAGSDASATARNFDYSSLEMGSAEERAVTSLLTLFERRGESVSALTAIAGSSVDADRLGSVVQLLRAYMQAAPDDGFRAGIGTASQAGDMFGAGLGVIPEAEAALSVMSRSLSSVGALKVRPAERLAEHRWQEDAAAPVCPICQQEWTLTVRRHHCRSCGSVVCASCSKSDWPFVNPSNDDTLEEPPVKFERVCSSCIPRLRRGESPARDIVKAAALSASEPARRQGVCSSFLQSCAPATPGRSGHVVRIMPLASPTFRLPVDPAVSIVMVAIGTAVSPFLSMLRRRLSQPAPSGSAGRMIMLLGVRTHDALPFETELAELCAAADGRLIVRVAFSRERVSGSVTDGSGWRFEGISTTRHVTDLLKLPEAEDVQELLSHENAHLYICGKPAMVPDIRSCVSRLLDGEDVTFPLRKPDGFARLVGEERVHIDVFDSGPSRTISARMPWSFVGKCLGGSILIGPSSVAGDSARVGDDVDDSRGLSVLHGRVFELGAYLRLHPGGDRVLLDKCGRDMSKEFECAHGPGNWRVASMLDPYCVGSVVTPDFQSPAARQLYESWLLVLDTAVQSWHILRIEAEGVRQARRAAAAGAHAGDDWDASVIFAGLHGLFANRVLRPLVDQYVQAVATLEECITAAPPSTVRPATDPLPSLRNSLELTDVARLSSLSATLSQAAPNAVGVLHRVCVLPLFSEESPADAASSHEGEDSAEPDSFVRPAKVLLRDAVHGVCAVLHAIERFADEVTPDLSEVSSTSGRDPRASAAAVSGSTPRGASTGASRAAGSASRAAGGGEQLPADACDALRARGVTVGGMEVGHAVWRIARLFQSAPQLARREGTRSAASTAE